MIGNSTVALVVHRFPNFLPILQILTLLQNRFLLSDFLETDIFFGSAIRNTV